MLIKDPKNERTVDKNSREFYKSWEWKRARYEILLEYGAVCMLCCSEHRIVVDHIKPRSRYPDLELDLNNLQVLCDACNQGKGNHDETDFRPYPFEGRSESERAELKLVYEAEKRL